MCVQALAKHGPGRYTVTDKGGCLSSLVAGIARRRAALPLALHAAPTHDSLGQHGLRLVGPAHEEEFRFVLIDEHTEELRRAAGGRRETPREAAPLSSLPPPLVAQCIRAQTRASEAPVVRVPVDELVVDQAPALRHAAPCVTGA